MVGSPGQTESRHFVHVRDVRGLKWSLAAERTLRFVGNTIRNDEGKFHENRSSFEVRRGTGGSPVISNEKCERRAACPTFSTGFGLAHQQLSD